MLVKINKDDDDDFVVGSHYLATFSLFQTSEDLRTAILFCQNYSSGGPLLIDVSTGEEHRVSSTSFYMKCEMSAENLPVTTGRDLLMAHCLKHSIGYGSLWLTFLENKYGGCTKLSPTRGLGLRILFDEQIIPSILYGGELEGNGKYSHESNADFDPTPLSKEEKLKEMINILANYIRIRQVVNVRVLQNNAVKILPGGEYYYYRPIDDACEYAIKRLSLQHGIYYPARSPKFNPLTEKT